MSVPETTPLHPLSGRVGIISADVSKATVGEQALARGEHMVYRFLSSAGRCVYVGVTSSPLNRWQAHANTKSWWREVDSIYFVAGLSRAEAGRMERESIAVDRPAYNGLSQ